MIRHRNLKDSVFFWKSFRFFLSVSGVFPEWFRKNAGKTPKIGREKAETFPEKVESFKFYSQLSDRFLNESNVLSNIRRYIRTNGPTNVRTNVRTSDLKRWLEAERSSCDHHISLSECLRSQLVWTAELRVQMLFVRLSWTEIVNSFNKLCN